MAYFSPSHSFKAFPGSFNQCRYMNTVAIYRLTSNKRILSGSFPYKGNEVVILGNGSIVPITHYVNSV